MPVFTKENEKTNVDYLRELIKGNDEANEFLDAIKDELDGANELIKGLEDDIKTLESDKHELKTEIVNLEEEKEYEDVIDTNMGPKEYIRWEAPNLAAKSMMEELGQAISMGIPLLKIEGVLRAL